MSKIGNIKFELGSPTDILKSFIVGSSILVTIVTLTYTGKANVDKKVLPFEIVAIVIPIIFGLANIVANSIKGGNYNLKMLIIGAIMGVLLSFYGTFIKQLPTKLFGFTEDNKYYPLFIAPFLYAFIFGINVNYLNRIFNLN